MYCHDHVETERICQTRRFPERQKVQGCVRRVHHRGRKTGAGGCRGRLRNCAYRRFFLVYGRTVRRKQGGRRFRRRVSEDLGGGRPAGHSRGRQDPRNRTAAAAGQMPSAMSSNYISIPPRGTASPGILSNGAYRPLSDPSHGENRSGTRKDRGAQAEISVIRSIRRSD